jgi:hypothetical protein
LGGFLEDHVGPARAAHLLLLESAEVAHGAVLAQRPTGVFVVPDFGDAGQTVPEGHQPAELAHLLREDRGEQVEQLVDHEVHQREVAVVPALLGTLVFVVAQDGLDLAHPVETQAFLLLRREGGAGRADEAEHCPAEVVLALYAVDAHPICEGPPEEVGPARPIDDIADHSSGASDHEVLVPQERQITDNPVVGLYLFVLVPLIGREEAINIGYVQVLAEQATNLCLAPQWVVPDGQRSALLLAISSVRSHGAGI